MVVGLLVDVERERLGVFVSVADGEPAVGPLDQQQLGAGPARRGARRRELGADLELVVGGRTLRFPAVWLRDNCPCAGSVAPGTGPVRLHVAAKRYLCVTEPGYFGLLSQESVRTLVLQGGPMTPEQAATFEALPFARDAVAVRRWDDEAKDPAVTPPAFAYFEPLLGDLPRA